MMFSMAFFDIYSFDDGLYYHEVNGGHAYSFYLSR